MVLTLNSCVIYEHARITHDTAHRTGAVLVNLNEFLRLRRFLKLRCEFLLNADDHTFVCFDTDRGATMLINKNMVLTKFLNSFKIVQVFLFLFDNWLNYLHWRLRLRTRSDRYGPPARMCWHHDRSAPYYTQSENLVKTYLPIYIAR